MTHMHAKKAYDLFVMQNENLQRMLNFNYPMS